VELTKFTINIVASAISNNGEDIYCDDENGEAFYYAKLGKAPELLAASIDYTDYTYSTGYADNQRETFSLLYFYGVYLNKDHSELIFSSEGSSYFVKNGDKVKISDAKLNFPYIYDAAYYHTKIMSRSYPLNNLLDSVFISENEELYYIDENFNITTLAIGVSWATLTEDGKYLYYIYDGALFRLVFGNTNPNPECIAYGLSRGGEDELRNYFNYLISPGGDVYLRNENGQLFWLNKESIIPHASRWTGSMMISEYATPNFGITSANLLMYCESGTSLYMLEAGRTTKITDKLAISKLRQISRICQMFRS
jgi:hypothetical protein